MSKMSELAIEVNNRKLNSGLPVSELAHLVWQYRQYEKQCPLHEMVGVSNPANTTQAYFWR